MRNYCITSRHMINLQTTYTLHSGLLKMKRLLKGIIIRTRQIIRYRTTAKYHIEVYFCFLISLRHEIQLHTRESMWRVSQYLTRVKLDFMSKWKFLMENEHTIQLINLPISVWFLQYQKTWENLVLYDSIDIVYWFIHSSSPVPKLCHSYWPFELYILMYKLHNCQDLTSVKLNFYKCQNVLVSFYCMNCELLWPRDHREDYRYCAWPIYSFVQIIPKALHSD